LLAGDSASWALCRSLCLFQSTPAIAGGRLKGFDEVAGQYGMFQSTPAIAGGRLQTLNDYYDYLWLFQSTPAIAGGRLG